MSATESDKLNENTTSRFSVNQISDSAAITQIVGQAVYPSENIEIMSGSVSSTVSSGGNNTPYIEGTPTSTVHSQHGKQTERYFGVIISKHYGVEYKYWVKPHAF